MIDSQVSLESMNNLVLKLHLLQIQYKYFYLKKGKKKTMKTKIDTKKLYFTARHVSVELISMLQSKDLSQENEDTVKNGLNSVSLYELNSLVDQIVLYCGVLLKFQVSTTLLVCTMAVLQQTQIPVYWKNITF